MIVFVDDEHSTVAKVSKELQNRGIECRTFDNVETAWHYLDADGDNVQLVVLDVMMPPRELIPLAEAEDGMSTGIAMWDRLRRRHPKLRMVLLTQITDPELGHSVDLGRSTIVLRKRDLFYDEIADEIQRFLKGQKGGAK